MWALANIPALPVYKRTDHAFILGEVIGSTIGLGGADVGEATLLPCQGRMSTCYLVHAEDRSAVVKIRPVDRISLSPGNQKAVAVQRHIKNLIVSPETYSFGVATHPTTGFAYEYVVEEYLPFSPPQLLSSKQRIRMFSALGASVRSIHNVKTVGFGDVISYGDTRFVAGSWREWVKELLGRCRFRELASAGLLRQNVAERAARMVLELADMSQEAALYHGDLLGNWANFLVDERLKVRGFLDWEFAGSGAPFENEIASVLYCFVRDGVPLAEQEVYLEALLEGFEVSKEQFIQVHRPVVEALMIVHAAKAINRIFPGATPARLDRTDREKRIVFARRARALIGDLV